MTSMVRVVSLSRCMGFNLSFNLSVYVCFCLSLWASAGSGTVLQDPRSPDVFDQRERNVVIGLRKRGLTDFAESHCEELLLRPELTQKDHALIAVEQIRNRTTRGSLEPDQQPQQVESISKLVERFEVQHKSNARLPLVWMQQALAQMTFAKQASRSGKAARGIRFLKDAKSVLEKNGWEVSQQLQGRRPQPGLDDDQLKSLDANIQYRLAVSDLVLASLYQQQGNNLDKIDSLNSSLKRLEEVRKRVSDTRELWWKTKIDQLAGLRLMEEFGRAAEVLQSLHSKKRPKTTDMLMLEQAFELAIAKGERESIMETAAGVNAKTLDRAETEIAFLKLLLVAGRSEGAAEVAGRIARHGPYWSRQADLMLLGQLPASANDSAPVIKGERILLRIANEALAKNNFADAAKAFEQVARERIDNGNPDAALAAIVQGGKAHEQAKDFQAAATMYLDYSKRVPDSKIAPSVHLRGCWTLTQLQPMSPDFTARLMEHTQTWPGSSTSGQASGWLAGQLVRESKIEQALDALLKIDPASTAFGQNLGQIRFCLDRMVEQRSDRGTARNLISRLERVQKNASGLPKANLACEMAMVAFSCGDPVTGKRLTQPRWGIDEQESQKNAFPFGALILNACQRLAGNSNTSPAIAVSRSLDGGLKMTELRRAVAWMQQVPANEKLAQLQLELAKTALEKEGFDSAADQAFLRQTQAIALAATGRTGDAAELFQLLISQTPNSLALRRAMARSLGEPSGDPEKALGQWRWIASRTRNGTESWFEAKYQSARMLVALGRKQEAQKLLRFIKAVPPGWEKSKYRNLLEKLLLECR